MAVLSTPKTGMDHITVSGVSTLKNGKPQKEIARLHERLTWSDAQFLAERDAAYVAAQRRLTPAQIETQERDMRDDPDTEGYVGFYHTDEG